jgi:hypothetical protein
LEWTTVGTLLEELTSGYDMDMEATSKKFLTQAKFNYSNSLAVREEVAALLEKRVILDLTTTVFTKNGPKFMAGGLTISRFATQITPSMHNDLCSAHPTMVSSNNTTSVVVFLIYRAEVVKFEGAGQTPEKAFSVASGSEDDIDDDTHDSDATDDSEDDSASEPWIDADAKLNGDAVGSDEDDAAAGSDDGGMPALDGEASDDEVPKPAPKGKARAVTRASAKAPPPEK